FRIAQESLNNALKYSKGRHVSLELRNGSRVLTLTTIDDGVGFDVDAAWGKGLGLVSIAERLGGVGGPVESHSTPDGGTRLGAGGDGSAAPDAAAGNAPGLRTRIRATACLVGRPRRIPRAKSCRHSSGRTDPWRPGHSESRAAAAAFRPAAVEAARADRSARTS